MTNALDEYFSSLIRSAESATGAPLDGGTVIAPEDDRSGSRSATSYPTPAGTIVWCDPALVGTLEVVLAATTAAAIDSERFVGLATGSGATLSGFGNNRVLVDASRISFVDPSGTGLSVRRLDASGDGDLALIADFASAASGKDLDEADLDVADLDQHIIGVVDRDRLVAYASGRPSAIDERFDDIGVLTHPDRRRRGLGSLAVSEFIRHRLATAPERLMLYRCTTENEGSNAIAESLGFTLAHTIGAVRFAPPLPS